MTQEEKAKAYDEAVKKLKVLHDDWATTQNRAAKEVEEIFPEFAEPKDERIMKIIRQSLKSYFEGKLSIGTNDVDYAICLSWLEKQGNLMKALQISNAKIGELIEKNYYLREQLEKQGEHKPTDKIKPKFKVGDIVKHKDNPHLTYILKRFTDDGDYEFHAIGKDGNEGCTCFSVVKYQDEWELVEQKPTVEMKTPEESLGIDSDTYNKIVDECIYGKQKPTDKIESRQEELTEFEKAVKQVMEEAIECGDTHNLKADADLLLRLVQKSSWGEEDIELLDNTIKFIEDRVAATSPSLRTYSPTLTGKEIPFLKALKDRYTWRPSDEQMLAINTAINVIGKGTINGKYLIKLQEQLKKLREA